MLELPASFLRGSYPPLVTPFRHGSVDYDAYAALVERHIADGSHGILVNGTTGEPSTLTLEERRRLLEIAVEACRRRVPVVAATGSQSHAETVALTEHAEAAGAEALLVVTPYYIRPPQRGIAAYFKDIARRTSLPLMMYHIPGRAAVSVNLDTLVEIAEAAPNFVGMKHASTDLSLLSDALDRIGPDFRVFAGLEDLSLPMLALGAAGMMNAVGNIWPRRVADLFEAVESGNLKLAREIHYQLWGLNQAVFFDTNPIPLKYMMKRTGLLPENEHRLPMMPASQEVAARCDQVLRAVGLITGNGAEAAA